ncbi:MAG: hypothetical protein ACD_5C00246G0004 [uncultured bacterium]|nr:MAG: hypothetical protein ACD_5C00246G0004 [uncultured bacterium]
MNLTEAVRAIFMAIILSLDLEYELEFKLQSRSTDGIDRATCKEIKSLIIVVETDGNEIQCKFEVLDGVKKEAVLQAGLGRPGIITKDAVAKLTQECYPEAAKEYAKCVYGFARSIATA